MRDIATTFLFTDIEGSTRLWEQEPERMRGALACHDAIARAAVAAHGGQVVKMTGDGIHAAFASAEEGLAAALEMQRSFANAANTAGLELRVRCGLHSGAHQARDNDFYGTTVNRAARIMSAAHGGQVLMSSAVAQRVADRMPEGAALRDLGIVRLRDLSSPDRLFQLVHPALRADFPALHSLEETPNNLPQALSSFVGREREIREIKARLRDHRLVTLVGMGGVGKTRLSMHVAAESLEEHRHGVWLVEMGPLHEPGRVAQAIATTLGVKEEAGRSVQEALARHVRELDMLVVVDNCEHVLQGCAEAARSLLAAAPGLRILATSREPMRIAGEATYLVTGLPVPGPREAMTSKALGECESVRLFVDRARAALPSFELSEENATSVAAICHRLDGIPLAIELAAARTRSIPIPQIAARLKDRFRLLTSGDPTASPRQRTLRALIDWSHDLLPEDERALFRRLAVFAGGWTLESGEAVCAGNGIEPDTVLDLLSRLVEKSLVSLDGDAQRYRMLETVREYARERLAEAGEEERAADAHLAHFLALAERARPQLAGAGQREWLARLDAEHDNMLAAHDWAGRDAERSRRGLQLLNSLKLYWANRGMLELGHRLWMQALQRPGADAPDRSRCLGLFNAGQFRYFMGRHEEARQSLEESLRIARTLGDAPLIGHVLQPLGMAAIAQGDLRTARRRLEEAVSLAAASGDPRWLAGAVNALAMLHRMTGELDLARPLLERVVSLSRASENREIEMVGLLNLAMVTIDAGAPAEAAAMLGSVLDAVESTGSAPAAQSALEVCAGLAATRGEWRQAARFYGAAEALALRSGVRRDAADERFLAPRIGQARAQLGEAAFASARAGGESTDTAATLAEARSWLARTPALVAS